VNGSVQAGDIQLLTQALFEFMPGLLTWSAAVTLHTIRFAIVLMILPLTAEGVLNNMSRMGIAAMLALYVALGRPAGELAALGSSVLLAVVVKEMIIGVALGFAMSTVFWVIEYVGALIDNAAGYNSVQVHNPLSSEQSTPVSDLLLRLAGAMFFAIGGGVFFVQAMFESFQVWPVVELFPSAQGAYAVFIERQLGSMFSNTLKLAAPLLIILLLIDVAMGLLARSAEKLEPANLAQPIKGIVAVLVVMFMVGTVFDPLREYLVPRGVVQQMLPDQAAPPAPR
jgi:type III secretion protein T